MSFLYWLLLSIITILIMFIYITYLYTAKQSVFFIRKRKFYERETTKELGLNIPIQQYLSTVCTAYLSLVHSSVNFDDRLAEIMSVEPDFFMTHLVGGMLCMVDGRFDQALPLYKRARELVLDGYQHMIPTEEWVEYIINNWENHPLDSRMDEVVDGLIWVVKSNFWFTCNRTGDNYNYTPTKQCMTVVKLSNGNVVLIDPMIVDEQIIDEIKNIGPVTHLVISAVAHGSYILHIAKYFPDAVIYGTPSHRFNSPTRFGSVPFQGFLTEKEQLFPDDMEMFEIKGSVLEDFVFYHRKTRTLLGITDFILLSDIEDYSSMTYEWIIGCSDGDPIVPGMILTQSYHHCFTRRVPARKSLLKILANKIDLIIAAHGGPLPNTNNLLENSFDWILKDDRTSFDSVNLIIQFILKTKFYNFALSSMKKKAPPTYDLKNLK